MWASESLVSTAASSVVAIPKSRQSSASGAEEGISSPSMSASEPHTPQSVLIVALVYVLDVNHLCELSAHARGADRCRRGNAAPEKLAYYARIEVELSVWHSAQEDSVDPRTDRLGNRQTSYQIVEIDRCLDDGAVDDLIERSQLGDIQILLHGIAG